MQGLIWRHPMQLTQQTDLALRLLMVLARRGNEALSVAAFAEEQGLSYHHMAKVVQALGRAGYVESLRGRTGGVRLARAAEHIRIGDVVRDLEPRLQAADCAACRLSGACGLSGLLGEAMKAFLATLDGKTLAEMAPPVGRGSALPIAFPRTGDAAPS